MEAKQVDAIVDNLNTDRITVGVGIGYDNAQPFS